MELLAALFIISVWVVSGSISTYVYKGCFSSSIVDKYAFYYKMNQSLTLNQSVAACNNRLTRYLGLQDDKRSLILRFAYCGNDLGEVSPKSVNSSHCLPCYQDPPYLCGEEGFMAVYMLRETSPLALLISTDRGIDFVVENITTMKIPSPVAQDPTFINYIYTEDAILFLAFNNLYRIFRSTYASSKATYTSHQLNSESVKMLSLGMDFLTKTAYFTDKSTLGLYKLEIAVGAATLSPNRLSGFTHGPTNICVDPYSRFIVLLEDPLDMFYLFQYDVLTKKYLQSYDITKVIQIAVDVHGMLIYAIVIMTGSVNTKLVSFDYEIGHMVMLYEDSQLANVKALEVFRGKAMWLVDVGDGSTIHMCVLTPRCHPDNITSYHSSQIIHSFTIYHPEKQTPGERRLCANMSCAYGCRAFTPFTARCSCPPGMEMGPDNFCYELCTTPTLQDLTTGVPTVATTVMTDSTMQQGVTLIDLVGISCLLNLFLLLGIVSFLVYMHRKRNSSFCPEELTDIRNNEREVSSLI